MLGFACMAKPFSLRQPATKKSSAALNAEINDILSRSAPRQSSESDRRTARELGHSQKKILYFLLHGDYTLSEVRAADAQGRSPRESTSGDRDRQSALVSVFGRNVLLADFDTWLRRHNQHTAKGWLQLLIDGDIAVSEMRSAMLARRAPKRAA
jgi:hypothetical protein